ncbi:TIGR02302 family protein [Gemmobacter aquarius]|uniref:TIGR02302 family protein n=1 Tax=Paragemmobacter aquarius TaxID=2169400 RepID=A0A2S0UPT4_9RHOB|nr:TIGR02302 family protein [Gemmobacter aquarius]AWB49823.1 TIGR02302 family protein [Gemmobacter aquarius]
MTDDIASTLKAIARPLQLTLVGMWAERLVRCFWPLWSIVIATLSALAFGLQDALPIEVAWPALILSGLAALGFLWTGLRRFHRPTRTDALIRLDQRLPGRPLATLTDTQAIGSDDPASLAVWQAHRARMAARAARATAVEPDLRLASRDPFALRYVALTAFVMAMIFGSLWRVTSVEALAPGSGANIAAGPTWEGWAQPPAYTGKPTIYLNDVEQTSLDLPVGTRLQFRLYGEVGELTLSETVSQSTEVAPASEPVHDFVLRQSGKVSVDGTGGRAWEFTATPDTKPSVVADATLEREADGKLKQKFTATDDYGVTAGQVSIALDLPAVQRAYGLAADPEPREPAVLDLPMPVNGSRADFTETLVDDLSKHPFANLPVAMTFQVTDAANQQGTAAPLHVTLPGKRFFDPFAAALIEMRRDLLWNRTNAPQVAQILKAVTHRPEGFIRNQRAYLRLRAVMRDLDTQAASLTPEARDTMAEELWQIALLVDEGDLASALENLRRAQDRLDQAIKNGADKSEIDQLMKELRQAMNDYMRQLAQEAEKNPDQQQSQNLEGMQMSADQLQKMLDELQKLMEEGKTAEAQQLMELLRQMMENMQVVQGQGQGQGGPGQQAMRDLQDTLRGQQGLSDDAFRDLQDGQEGQQGEGEGQQGEDGKGLADRQRELRDKLGQLQGGQLPGDGSEQGEEGRRQLDRAGRAMDEAEDALRDGDLPKALDRQAEAMEAMRDGMQNFGDALAENQGQPGDAPQGEEFGQADPNGQRDPLGREPGNSARIGSDRNMLQGQDVYRRAQDLLDEIRRRSGEQIRPEGERDYLRRLLDMF